MQTVTGKIKYIVYSSADYAVLDVKTKHGRIKVTGINLPENTHVSYVFHGDYSHHPKYGESFKAAYADIVIPEKKNDTIEYLASGLFPGIGQKMAERIVEEFGDDAVKKIEADPMSLAEVKGISRKRARKIADELYKNREVKKLIEDLGEYGIAPDQCMRLFKIHGSGTAKKLEENPYIMMRDLKLTFAEADGIARKMGIGSHDERRLKAAGHEVFSDSYMEGSTGVELQAFGRKTAALLGEVSGKELSDHVLARMNKGELHVLKPEGTERYVFTNAMYDTEKAIADELVRIGENKITPVGDVSDKIHTWERKKGFVLDAYQFIGIKKILEGCPVVVIKGGPGTGKTTIMSCVTDIASKEGRETVLLAPTGRAARKLAEYTGHEASTIHSYLGVYDNSEAESERDMTRNALVIADEFSMCDTKLAKTLFSNIGEGCSLVLVGDTDQLPSVGPGAVLRDIMSSKAAEVISLDTVFRTERDSNILYNVREVAKGSCAFRRSEDFAFYRSGNTAETSRLLTDLYEKRIREYGMENVMLLVPYRKGRVGVEEINRILQEKVNPPSFDKAEVKTGGRIFREGDIVMHLKNTQDASNGDIGVITSIKEENDANNSTICAIINNKEIRYGRDEYENLDLAYAMTVHKSQGSEAKSVIFAMTADYPAMCYRNIPYVAFSRGKERVDCIYDMSLKKSVETVRSEHRVTLLGRFLKELCGEFVPI